MFKSNRSKSGMGNWIGSTNIWDDPRARIDITPVPDRDDEIPASWDDEDLGSAHDGPPSNSAIAPMYVEISREDPRSASKAQLNFLRTLFAQRSNSPEAVALRLGALTLYKQGRLSMTAASDFITVIKRIPRDI